jgi:aminoglycoside phosphotransferase (APT) family kinase protein
MPSRSEALHAHALASLEAADMAAAHAPDLDIDGPYLSTDITAEFLQATLGGSVPGAVLEKLEHQDGHDGMTSRIRWRLRWNDTGRRASLPEGVFVKATPEQPYLRETLSLLHMAENEVRFYNQIRPEVPDLAPEAYYAASYAGGRFLLVMETLENRGLKPYWMADDCSLDHAKAVVAALARLHATYWETDRFTTDLAWVRPRTSRFGFEWHQRSFRTARERYLGSEMGQTLPAEIIDLIRFWDRNDRAVYAYWDRLPPTVLHGDSHLGNTYSTPDGQAGFFDWQVIYRGHGLRDVAYFFLSAADETLRDHEREIVDHYLNHLEHNGVALDRETAWTDYRLFSLDALDAHIKTTMFGGYGHASAALERGRTTLTTSLLRNAVPNLLHRVVRDGRP